MPDYFTPSVEAAEIAAARRGGGLVGDARKRACHFCFNTQLDTIEGPGQDAPAFCCPRCNHYWEESVASTGSPRTYFVARPIEEEEP